MRHLTLSLAAAMIVLAAFASAQDRGIHVPAIRVLPSDPDALATFYAKAFGMSETRRPMNTPTFKEIVLNTGATPDQARAATTTPIVIATRPRMRPRSSC